MGEINGRRETHDFMNVNVESFSQLPFIRRAPVKEKGAIRLFGKEFGAGDHAGSSGQEDSDSSETTSSNNNNKNNNNSKNEENAENHKDNHISSRRFECHYCFRNFPTSQALGGHQNAHKRERQHAKRGATYLHQPDSHHHVYGFLSNHHHRHRLGGSASCPSWNSAAPAARFYGGHSSSYYTRTTTTTPPTINGSPLGLWRVPAATAIQGVYAATAFNPDRSSNSTLTLSASDQHEAKDALAGGSAAQNRYWYGLKANVQDHVSLDLHL